METLETIFWAIVVVGVLVFFHELGHFLVARWCKVRVLCFSLGFGPKIWSHTPEGSHTEYALSAIPLGGYVKMLGESPEESSEEPLTPEEKKEAFSLKPLYQRFAVVFAGPAFNFIFAIMAYTMANMIGVEELQAVVGKVSPDLPAEVAGVQEGDRILAVDGVEIESWNDLRREVGFSQGGELNFLILREGSQITLRIEPKIHETTNIFKEKIKVPIIGVTASNVTKTVHYSGMEALNNGVQKCWSMVNLIVEGLWKMITQVVGADQIGGPILIAQVAGKAAQAGLIYMLHFMAQVSISLGVLNLLPIPILDGGHLMFYTVEAVKGSPVSIRAQMMAQQVGLFLLISLMVFATYNDLMRIFR